MPATRSTSKSNVRSLDRLWRNRLASDQNLRIVLAHELPVVCSALAAWFESGGGVQVVATAPTVQLMVDECSRHKPDVLVLDVRLGEQPTFAAAAQALLASPHSKLCFMCDVVRDRDVAQAMDMGTTWFICLSDSPADARKVIEAMKADEPLFAPSVSHRIARVSGGRKTEAAATRGDRLSERQREVLRYVASGMSKREVAEKMFISPRTVERHVANIMGILDIHDRVHLTRYAIREGLVEL